MPMRAYLFVAVLLFALIGLNGWATWRVFRSDYFEPSQKRLQVVLIWLVPLIMALLAIGVTRKNPEKTPGNYQEGKDNLNDIHPYLTGDVGSHLGQ